jgi:hypothetical protein
MSVLPTPVAKDRYVQYVATRTIARSIMIKRVMMRISAWDKTGTLCMTESPEATGMAEAKVTEVTEVTKGHPLRLLLTHSRGQLKLTITL